ncbi:hypothetical protein GGH91_001184 [Coemansia sp. RSA 2671]|nr:hypothetical protein LPJ60_001918 [Coemansia sp. RSA 2675]KAJ2348799.1 hypothetical protein GGH91_001184 [Coemansia sp. RSA 2671]
MSTITITTSKGAKTIPIEGNAINNKSFGDLFSSIESSLAEFDVTLTRGDDSQETDIDAIKGETIAQGSRVEFTLKNDEALSTKEVNKIIEALKAKAKTLKHADA